MAWDIRKIVKEGYEKGDYAVRFRAGVQPQGMEKEYLDRLISLVPGAARILDLGCGIGIPFDKYLADRGFEVVGIDLAHRHCERARKEVPNATFLEGDFSKTDFGGTRFHAIIALYSVFHIPREEQQGLFDSMRDWLEDGGVILMTLGTRDGESMEEDWTGAPMAWSSHDPATYRVMIAQAGLEIVESSYEGRPGDAEHHWWVLARKSHSRQSG